MRFFGELFEKKICPICGGEIGLLGNRRLADGNLCKKCARKLSPWFDERRESTAAQIDEQLRDRERNLEELRGFSSSREVSTVLRCRCTPKALRAVGPISTYITR